MSTVGCLITLIFCVLQKKKRPSGGSKNIKIARPKGHHERRETWAEELSLRIGSPGAAARDQILDSRSSKHETRIMKHGKKQPPRFAIFEFWEFLEMFENRF